MSSFLILGHGTEEIVNFNERPVMKEGYTLVTIAECGIVTRQDDVCPMVEAFTDPANEDIFQNPRVYKQAIRTFLNGKDIHIYEAGKKYPKLEVQLFVDFRDKNIVEVFKSGLYAFPADRGKMQLTKDAPTYCASLFQTAPKYEGFRSLIPTDFPFDGMYEGSLYPTSDDLRAAMMKTRLSASVKEAVTVPIETLFEKGGPGVYYFVICRTPKSVLSPEELVRDLDLLDEQAQNLTPYFVNNWASHLEKIIPILEKKLKPPMKKDPEKMTEQEKKAENKEWRLNQPWQRNVIDPTLKAYKALVKVPLIRSLSIEQQGRGRRMRKTKRVRKAKTSTRRRKI